MNGNVLKNNIADVEFDEGRHVYMYHGRRLFGITGAICDRLGRHYPAHLESVAVQTSYGSQVHKDVERAINSARTLNDIQRGVETEGGKWVAEALLHFARALSEINEGIPPAVYAERRVSDFEATASNVDIVLEQNGRAILFDIKTGEFDREYCTLQLNAYRLMYQMSYGVEVVAMHVLGVKRKRVYSISKGREEACQDLFDRNFERMEEMRGE